MTQEIVMPSFDYDAFDLETRIVAQQKAGEIKTLERTATQAIVDIGGKLVEVKDRLPHGQFQKWIEAEFALSLSAAQKMMAVYHRFKSVNFTHLSIGISALYMLAAASTPDEIADMVIQRAQAGEVITHGEVKTIIGSARPVTSSTPAQLPAALWSVGTYVEITRGTLIGRRGQIDEVTISYIWVNLGEKRDPTHRSNADLFFRRLTDEEIVALSEDDIEDDPDITHPIYSNQAFVEAICPKCGRQHPRWLAVQSGNWECLYCQARVADGDMRGVTNDEIKEQEAAKRHQSERNSAASKERRDRDARIDAAAATQMQADRQLWANVLEHVQGAIALIEAMPEKRRHTAWGSAMNGLRSAQATARSICDTLSPLAQTGD